MRASVYGAVVINPVNFPDDLEILIFPLRSDGSPIGGSFPLTEHRSWEWVCKRYPGAVHSENQLRAGERANVLVASLVGEFPDDVKFPADAIVEVLN